MRVLFAVVLAMAVAWGALPAPAEAAAPEPFKVQPADDAWRAALPRDAELATRAFLDRLPAQTVARADAYFEGGYWLQLWNFLLGLLVAWVLLARGRAARFRARALRRLRRPWLVDAVMGLAYVAASWALTLPLTVYQGFVREHAYGLATQSFGPWLGEQVLQLGIVCIVAFIAVPLLYAFIRRHERSWWLGATALSVGVVTVLLLVGPVWIDPLFNTYKPVQDPAIKATVLAMAHANGVPVDNLYEVDQSRQTTRVSANVSGIFGTAQVRLNDNLLRRASLPEIRAVMGHELGHYVLSHVEKMLAFLALLLLVGFGFTQWLLGRLLRRWGGRWGLQGVGDAAALPLLAAAFSVFTFLATPVFNTLVRVQEVEADRFGLNLSREPLGMAEATLKLTEYRKPDPGPLEEFIFFDHPSTRFRIHDAMRWREAMRADGPAQPLR